MFADIGDIFYFLVNLGNTVSHISLGWDNPHTCPFQLFLS